LLTEIKLKENEGMQRTSVKIKVSEILTVPIWVTAAYCPLGNFTVLEVIEVIEVNKEIEQIIWSVAPVSKIHGAFGEFMKGVFWANDIEDANTECFVSKWEKWEEIDMLPPIVEINWSWGEKVEATWLADEAISGDAGLNILMSCWHCSYVIGSWGTSPSETWLVAWEVFLPLVNLNPGGKPWSREHFSMVWPVRPKCEHVGRSFRVELPLLLTNRFWVGGTTLPSKAVVFWLKERLDTESERCLSSWRTREKNLVHRRQGIYQQDLSTNMRKTLIQSHEELINILTLMFGLQDLHSTTRAARKWLMIIKFIPKTFESCKISTYRIIVLRKWW